MAAYEARGYKNAGDFVVRENNKDIWLVPYSPIFMDKDIDWRHNKKNERIFVPVFSYLTANDPADALGFAAQLAMRAICDVGPNKLSRIHIVIGHPVNQVEDNATGVTNLQYYFGIGAVLK